MAISSKIANVEKTAATVSSETQTVYRGVNSSAGKAYTEGTKGIASARGGKMGHSNPTLHNEGATANSQFTSWTTNPAVATNYALRGSGKGIVLEKTVSKSMITNSPSSKSVQLIQNKSIIVNESEVLLRGTVKNAGVKTVTLP